MRSASGIRNSWGIHPKNFEDKTGKICLQRVHPQISHSAGELRLKNLTLSLTSANLLSFVRGANIIGHRVRRIQNAKKDPSPNAREIASCVFRPDVLIGRPMGAMIVSY